MNDDLFQQYGIDAQPQQQQQQATQQQQGGDDLFQQYGIQAQPQQQDKSNWFMDGVTAFNSSFTSMASGTISKVAELMGAKGVSDAYLQHGLQAKQEAEMAKANSPIAGTVGGVLGDVGAGTAFAGPSLAASPLGATSVIGKMAVGAVEGAATGAGLGYLDTPADGSDRGNKALVGGVVGGAVGAAIPAILSIPKFWNKYVPESKILKEGSDEIMSALGPDDLAKMQQNQELANKLGLKNVSPGMLSDNPVVKRIETDVLSTTDNKVKLYNSLIKDNEDTLLGKLKQTVDDIVPGNIDDAVAQQKALYSELDKAVIPDEAVASLKANESIAARFKSAQSSTDSLVKNLPDTSFRKWDAIKKNIDNEIWPKSGDAPNFTTKEALLAARKQIIDTLEASNPTYGEARKLSEQIMLYKDMGSKLGDVALRGAKDELNAVYNKLFNNTDKLTEFLDKLKSAGGDVQSAEDLIKGIDMVRGSHINSIINKAAPKESTILQNLNLINALDVRRQRLLSEGKISTMLSGGKGSGYLK